MKILKNKKYITAVSTLFLVAGIAGCGKNPALRTDYIVPVTVRETADGEAVPLSNIKAYGFYRDTVNFKPASYEQAVKGEMSETATNGTVGYDILGEYDTACEAVVFPNLEHTPVTLVVCDVVNELYAYSEKKLVAGVDKITVPLLFEPFRMTVNGSVVEANGWKIQASPRPEPDVPDETE